jgi:tetratricopeptide (TPR) repeat protein
MVICSLQVNSPSTLSGTSVTETPFRNILGLNQQTYERLKIALNLNLRRQIFIAVCDDLPLRDRLAAQLQAELAHFSTFASPKSMGLPTANAARARAIPKLVTLDLDLNDPNPIAQVAEWISYFPSPHGRQIAVPAFQVLGIEQLTRQSAAIQSLFLSYLQMVEQDLPLIESCLLFWMTQPWFRMLPEAASGFWSCRTGVFEFIGEPTPLPANSPERIQLNLSGDNPLRELPETPSNASERSSHLAINLPENPWIRLAEDLNLDESGPPPNITSQTHVSKDIVQTPGMDQWVAAFNQILEQELIDANSPLKLNQESSFHSLLSIATQSAAAYLNGQTADHATEQLSEQLPDYDQDLSLSEEEIAHFMSEGELAVESPNPANELEIEQTVPLLQHIELLQQQIELLHQGQESPIAIATAYRTLGNFYRDCIEQGDVSHQTLTVAVQAYEQALQWLPEATADQVDVLNDLGNLYWMLAQVQSEPEEAINRLQQTIQAYQLALNHLDSYQHSQTYAMVQNNLGAAYADLARYQNPMENLQQSVAAYQQVLQHRAAADDPLRYASTQNNLGTTYWNLAQYQQPEFNLKQAITAYSEALHYYDPKQDSLNYAMIQNNLGTAYWNLAQYEQAQDYLTLALSAYRVALQHRRLDNAPAGFAATQNNLGTVYWHLANHTPHSQERSKHLEQAILAYEAALKAADYLKTHQPEPISLNFDLTSTQNNLGLAHYQIAIDPHGHLDAAAQAHHLEAALQQHLIALQACEHNLEMRQTTINCILQVVRAFYNQLGLPGQNQALSHIPGPVLAEILPKL